MRLGLALLAFSLVGSAAASVIDAPRHIEVKHIGGAPKADEHELDKRRGGGGHGGGGHGGGRGGKSSGSSSGTRKGSNLGGYSSKGSGVQPTYGGGQCYAGGAGVPYPAGGATATGLIPFLLIGSALAFWPGTYHYDTPYRFYNASNQVNETREVICGCARYAVCSCGENNSTKYYDDLIGDGGYAAFNTSIVAVVEVNGTKAILINGTLPAQRNHRRG
ncbi:hypothetical protein EDB80DRAFT_884400 [Ilyonectria destructans]|nr:hypothetical protein EDB80DRAFT_884400 [Ilyonectria destructans]